MSTILLTGLPRSGTTLTCALLNEFPNTVALAEPLQLDPHGGREKAMSEIERFIGAARVMLLERGTALSKHVNGVVPDNWVEPVSAPSGQRLRKVTERHGLISVGKPLMADFTLIIKHPAEFTALADRLTDEYPLVALIRHPMAVLASWQTVDMPVNRGRMPMAEAFAPGLADRRDAIEDRIDRQVALLDWLLGVYDKLPRVQILRYEDMVADPAKQLQRFTSYPRAPMRQLEHFQVADRYPGVSLKPLARALLAICPVAARFYPDFEKSLEPFLG
jgi:hypothetical protein